MTPGTEHAISRARRELLSGTPARAIALLRAELAGAGGSAAELHVELSYAEVLRTRFGAAHGHALRAEGPGALAARAITLAFQGPSRAASLADIEQAFSQALATPDPSPFVRYLLAEAAMSNGAIDVAQHVAAPTAVADPLEAALLSQVRARALAFGGRLDEATAAVEDLLVLCQVEELLGLEALANGLAAYLAAQRNDRSGLRRSSRAALSLATSPAANYLHVGAHVLVAYALAADEQHALAAATLLTGAGADLTRLQFVDRAYGHELLAGAALHAGDLSTARGWLTQAQALPCAGMAAAAVARTEAMVQAAEGNLPAGAAAARRAVVGAGDRGGHLDATRARVLHGSAMSRIGSRQHALTELEEIASAATELGALRIRVLAVRELRRLGRRVPAPGRDPLSPREKQVALLVADGLSNRQVGRLLHLSERTVASHLATILRRLELTSRSALPAALGMSSTAADVALTDRQADVAALVAKGLSNAQIASELGVSAKTVEKHVSDALARCGLASRTALAAYWSSRT